MEKDLSELIACTESKLKSIKVMIEQLFILHEKEPEKLVEAKKIENNIKTSFYEIASLLKEAEEALKLKPDKIVWLRLGDIYYSLAEELMCLDSNLGKECREDAMKCYMEALVKHMKEFPEILRKIGFIPPFSYWDRKAFMNEYEAVLGFIPLKETTLGLSFPELQAHDKREERQFADFQIKMLKMYLDIYPNDVDALLEVAARYAILLENYPLSEHYRENCEAILEKVLKISPDDPRILTRAYRIYEKIWNFCRGEKRRQLLNKLIELLKKCCELEPASSFPWMELSRIYGICAVVSDREKNLEEAIRCMEEAIKRYESWLRWQRLGELYLRKGDKGKMLECYSRAFEEYAKHFKEKASKS